MIAILEWTQSNVQQNIEQLQTPTMGVTRSRILDLHLSISNDIVSTNIYDKRDDFDFLNCQFPIFRW